MRLFVVLLVFPTTAAANVAVERCSSRSASSRIIQVEPKPSHGSGNLPKTTVLVGCNVPNTEFVQCAMFEGDSRPIPAGSANRARVKLGADTWSFELSCFPDILPTLTNGEMITQKAYDSLAKTPSSLLPSCGAPNTHTEVDIPIKGLVPPKEVKVRLDCAAKSEVQKCSLFDARTEPEAGEKGGEAFLSAQKSHSPKPRLFALTASDGNIQFKLTCGSWSYPEAIYWK